MAGFITYRLAALYRSLKKAEEHVRLVEIRKAARMGEDVRLASDLVVKKPAEFAIGDRSYVARGCFFDCKGGLEIGKDCHISTGCVIYSHDHDLDERLPFGREIPKPVTIGDYVWLGASVRIVPGVSIGDGAVIGFGCTVTKDVAEREIVGSPPQRVIKERDEAIYKELS